MKRLKVDVFLCDDIVDGGKIRDSKWLCIAGENVGRIANYDGLFLVWLDNGETVNEQEDRFSPFVWLSYVPGRLTKLEVIS